MNLPDDFSPEEQLAASYLRQAARKEVDGLTGLFRLYQRPLLAFILRIVRDSGAAEEILEDVFLRAYERADAYDPRLGTPFVWMATIARRFSIDRLRRLKCRPQLIQVQTEHPESVADKEWEHEEFGTSQKLEAQLALEELRRLPEARRRVIELAFLHGYTQKEIAEALGKPLGTIKSDLRRGLLELRKRYLGEDD